MANKFNSKELTKKGEEYDKYAEIMEHLIDEGYPKDEVITAINYVGEMNSLDLGDEVYLFLKGVDYGKKKSQNNAKENLKNGEEK